VQLHRLRIEEFCARPQTRRLDSCRSCGAEPLLVIAVSDFGQGDHPFADVISMVIFQSAQKQYYRARVCPQETTTAEVFGDSDKCAIKEAFP
jgi:hypothetical protein